MINDWHNQIAEIIGDNMCLALIFVLISGILTSFTSCSLSSISLIIGYVGGAGEKNTKKAFFYSLTFSLGTAITFVILGIIVTSEGKLMETSSKLWYLILGTLMVLMSLQIWEIFNFIPSMPFDSHLRL